jgi:hypothetical protein
VLDLGVMLDSKKAIETGLPLKDELPDVIVGPALSFQDFL